VTVPLLIGYSFMFTQYVGGVYVGVKTIYIKVALFYEFSEDLFVSFAFYCRVLAMINQH